MSAFDRLLPDPTYNKTQIEADPIWHLAWIMSEMENDNAPIGWGKYISLARGLIQSTHVREIFRLLPND